MNEPEHEAEGAPPDLRDCYCATLEVPPSASDSAVRFKGRAALLNAKHWGAKRRLTVGFLGGTAEQRERVARLARGWQEAGAGVELIFWQDPRSDARQADLRVAFQAGRGSWSYLGTDARQIARDDPTINFGWLTPGLSETEARSVVLHEFGHALGLIHEHQNPFKAIQWDEAAVVRDLRGPPNNWDDATIRSNMFKRYAPGDLFATDVDPASIMMYPIPQSWTRDGFTVGFNSSLSDNDVKLIVRAYPRTGL